MELFARCYLSSGAAPSECWGWFSTPNVWRDEWIRLASRFGLSRFPDPTNLPFTRRKNPSPVSAFCTMASIAATVFWPRFGLNLPASGANILLLFCQCPVSLSLSLSVLLLCLLFPLFLHHTPPTLSPPLGCPVPLCVHLCGCYVREWLRE